MICLEGEAEEGDEAEEDARRNEAAGTLSIATVGRTAVDEARLGALGVLGRRAGLLGLDGGGLLGGRLLLSRGLLGRGLVLGARGLRLNLPGRGRASTGCARLVVVAEEARLAVHAVRGTRLSEITVPPITAAHARQRDTEPIALLLRQAAVRRRAIVAAAIVVTAAVLIRTRRAPVVTRARVARIAVVPIAAALGALGDAVPVAELLAVEAARGRAAAGLAVHAAGLGRAVVADLAVGAVAVAAAVGAGGDTPEAVALLLEGVARVLEAEVDAVAVEAGEGEEVGGREAVAGEADGGGLVGGGDEAAEGQEEGCLDHGGGVEGGQKEQQDSFQVWAREVEMVHERRREGQSSGERAATGWRVYLSMPARPMDRTSYTTSLDNSVGTSRSSPPELPRSLLACLLAYPTSELTPGSGCVKWRRERLGLTRRVLAGWSSISALRPKIRPLGSNGARVLCTILHIQHGETLKTRRGEAEEVVPAGMQDDDGCYHESRVPPWHRCG